MSDELVLVPTSHSLEVLRTKLRSVLSTWMLSKTEATRREYAGDLESFALWCVSQNLLPPGANGEDAVRELLIAGKLEAELRAIRYIHALREDKLTASTVMRRRSALRSCVNAFADAGLVPWTLQVKVPKSFRPIPYHNVTGPTLEQVRKMLTVAQGETGLQGARDTVIVVLMYVLGIRRKETVGIDIEDYRDGKVWVLGKGRTDKEWMTVPPEAYEALEAYLDLRGGPKTGPLFVSCDPAEKGGENGRLSKGGLWQVTKRLAKMAGIPLDRVSPHRFRHATITDSLEAGEDIRHVQRLSRHRKLETVVLYDDARQDVAGKVSQGRMLDLFGEGEREQICPTCKGKGKVPRS